MTDGKDIPKSVQLFIDQFDSSLVLHEQIRSVYYFKSGRKDLIVLDIYDYVKAKAIREIVFTMQCNIQDKLSFPENLMLSFIIRTSENFFDIDPFDENSFTYQEVNAFLTDHKLLYGHNNIDIPSEKITNTIEPILSAARVLQLSKKYPQYLPLLNPYVCWQRHDFYIKRNELSDILMDNVDNYLSDKKYADILLYGRYWGSGKTGSMYWLMHQCRKRNIPFIYRSAFWKDQAGDYKDDDEGLNEADVVSEWLLRQSSSLPENAKCVIFLDEVDYQPHDKLDKYLIIAGAKEIPDFVDESFAVFDLMVDYPFTHEQFYDFLMNLMNDKIREVFPSDLVRIIIDQHHKWRFPPDITDPAVATRIATYALASAIARKENGQVRNIRVKLDDIEYWISLADTHYISHYPEVHDVHAEFLVFDGTEYVAIDPHYSSPLP